MGCWLVRPTVQHSVQQITDVIDVLNANIHQAEKTQTALRAKARTYARSGNRKHAMHYLKRAKLFDHQIHILHERVLHCSQRIITLRNMHMASMQLQAIRSATRVFKDFTRQHDLDRVERLQDELEDGMQHVLEVSNMLEITTDDVDIDESTLEEELNELEMFDIPVAPDTPFTSPPTTQTCPPRSLPHQPLHQTPHPLPT